jgi:hypothetical protein
MMVLIVFQEDVLPIADLEQESVEQWVDAPFAPKC